MSKRTDMSISSVEEAVSAVVNGARIRHVGIFLSNDDTVRKGLTMSMQAVDYLDAWSPTGRDVLLPLLNHEDDAVRVTAAGSLMDGWPHLALPVIEDIRATSVTEAHITAFLILTHKEVFGFFAMGLSKPDPRFPNAECRRSQKRPN